jgi:ATP-dependent DNA helicase RecQ/Werner syndrome ATP-dependent helicase
MSVDVQRSQDSPQGVKRQLAMGFQGTQLKCETVDDPDLSKTLHHFFGHSDFKPGQREVIEAALAGRDTVVFWATGSGKSICYQMTALYSGKTVVVVSPLISLMTDQVHKFNATAGAAKGGPRAVFLGSAQADRNVETEAMRGCYQLVYVTPEKLCGGLLDRLKVLRSEGKLALIAVDEAHCISEWGHDFRPAYRTIKQVREVIPDVPLMALTATAVPRVQTDIVQQLSLASPTISRSSFDRPNLVLTCTRKTNKHADLTRIEKLIAEGGATIVYVPTQAETESVAGFLRDRLGSKDIRVDCYHGGRYMLDREKAHTDFLSGRIQVIVATVAFGMGIDKPDIRRIVHYGPPKTVEEYYQQVGRAGRDGLTAHCELISSDSDFQNYASEFYLGGLTPEAKEQQLKSTAALRSFAASTTCRRRWLLQYFGEEPTFGDWCGTCDNSRTAKTHAGDLTRDFRNPALIIFEAIACCEDFPRAMTELMSIIKGSWKPKDFERNAQRKVETMERIKLMKQGLSPVMRREEFLKELVGTLCNAGLLERRSVQADAGGRSITFDVYVRSAKGKETHASKAPVLLAVPQGIRQQEEEERKNNEKRKQELVEYGVDLKKIPVKELEHGQGETINAQLEWGRRLTSYRQRDQEEKAQKLEELKSRIERWRQDSAEKFKMAPGAVVGDALVFRLAYTKPTSVDALREVGVRIANVDELAALMRSSVDELFPEPKASTDDSDHVGNAAPAAMIFPSTWKPPKWEKAIYKTSKGGALPSWELYYNRWAKGEAPQAIAVNPPSGKAVQVSTVFGHVLTAMTHGKEVDLGLLSQQCDTKPPNHEEWQKMEEAAAVRDQNVDADDYKSKEVLCGILGEENVNVEPMKKSEDQKNREAIWYGRLKWWEALRRIRFPVKFEAQGGDSKRLRT